MRIKGWCSIDENASFLRASGNVLILRLDYERGENGVNTVGIWYNKRVLKD